MQKVSYVVVIDLPDGVPADEMGDAIGSDINDAYSDLYPINAQFEVSYVEDLPDKTID